MSNRESPGELRAKMRAFYGSSKAYKGLLDAHDAAYLRPYVALVRRFAPSGGRLLELGAGNGVAARMFCEAGFRVVGTDISPFFLRDAAKWQGDGLAYAVGDGLALPFRRETFDVVCSNEYLEHVPDAQTALDEMARVTVPGGRVVIVGPNLCSPFVPLRELVRWWRGASDECVWTKGMGDALRLAWRNVRLIRAKKRARTPEFLYRPPDLADDAIGGDSDSAYLVNPADLERYFHRRDWRIVALSAGFGWKGRLLARAMPRYAPYTCVVAEKPRL